MNSKPQHTSTRYRQTLLSGLLILLSASQPGWAGPTAIHEPSTEAIRVLTLATSEDFAPYVYLNEAGEFAGIDYEIVREVCKRLAIHLEVMLLPRPRISRMLSQGGLDGVVSTTSFNDPQVIPTLWQSTPLYSSSVGIFSLKSRQGKEGELVFQDGQFTLSEGVRVGMLEGFDYSPIGEPALTHLKQNALLVRTDHQLVNLLIHKRIAYVISEEISFSYQGRNQGVFDGLTNEGEVYSRPVRIGLSRQRLRADPGLEDRINSVIETLNREQFIDRVIYQNLRLDYDAKQAPKGLLGTETVP